MKAVQPAQGHLRPASPPFPAPGLAHLPGPLIFSLLSAGISAAGLRRGRWARRPIEAVPAVQPAMAPTQPARPRRRKGLLPRCCSIDWLKEGKKICAWPRKREKRGGCFISPPSVEVNAFKDRAVRRSPSFSSSLSLPSFLSLLCHLTALFHCM